MEALKNAHINQILAMDNLLVFKDSKTPSRRITWLEIRILRVKPKQCDAHVQFILSTRKPPNWKKESFLLPGCLSYQNGRGIVFLEWHEIETALSSLGVEK